MRFLLLVVLLFVATPVKATSPYTDLVLLENLPQVEASVQDNQLQLRAIHLYREGHFIKATDNLVWKSSKSRIAKVNDRGLVTFSGRQGKTWITVTDGEFSDRIAVQNLDGKPVVIPEQGNRYGQVIERVVQGLSVEEKIGQMLMPEFLKSGDQSVTTLTPEIEQLVKKYHIGGVILFRENFLSAEQAASLTYKYQKAAEKFGLFMAIDQEGGIVTRLPFAPDFPGGMALGATRDPELAFRVGQALGEELRALGINMNFAPVLDVNNNPDNPVIGVRSFGETPSLVADLSVAYQQGLQKAGLAATGKHFPGHGDTGVDSHLGLAEGKRLALYPFRKAISHGIDAIMTGHVTFPYLESTKVKSQLDGTDISIPATLSPVMLTKILREQMKFQGVITTDAMNMKAIADHFGPVDAAIRAVKAGADIVLMPVGLAEVAEGIFQAVMDGEILEERLDESVTRILTLKLQRGILKEETPPTLKEHVQNALGWIGPKKHQELKEEAALRSITLVKNDRAVLPLKMKNKGKIVVVGARAIEDLYEALRAHHPRTALVQLNPSGIRAYQPSFRQWAELMGADAVVVGTYTSKAEDRAADHAQMKLVKEIARTVKVPVIAVGLRNPYDIETIHEVVDGYLVQYGHRGSSSQATAKVLFGVEEPKGRLPVTIPDGKGGILYPFGHGLGYQAR
ncbi:glycoside hydrolase family 3 protein [Ammoniphilus sp. YIM 78166]|uniref:glycoside hydrolase family 3 protein n=1 Tax=Ammoniphilus sp. YIM 78166 TaxID=1644106 RepID=UPI00106F9225|nr:glycoside hydrolase family 3 protein [Ammoniphilus sp. YIM 78166]